MYLHWPQAIGATYADRWHRFCYRIIQAAAKASVLVGASAAKLIPMAARPLCK
jgi:hypothetical protein